jgi:hypothetical protein
VEAPFDTLYSDVGDVDGDGDVDLMLASWHGTELYRKPAPSDRVERAAACRRTLTLELYGRANEGCVLGLAFAPAAPPLVLPGIGTLRLDLMSLLIAAIGIYDVDGTGVFVRRRAERPDAARPVAVLAGPVAWCHVASRQPRDHDAPRAVTAVLRRQERLRCRDRAAQLQPLVAPQLTHLRQVPLRTRVNAPQPPHGSPRSP